MMNPSRALVLALAVLASESEGRSQAKDRSAPAAAKPLHVTLDLNQGESQEVELPQGRKVTVKLVALEEKREEFCSALVEARARVEVDGEGAWLTSGACHLPKTVGAAQVDCTVTRGVYVNAGEDSWGLAKEARIRVWPRGSPWLEPGTLVYPLKQGWFAGDTWMSNEPVLVRPGLKKIYYHSGFDIGGSEGMIDVVAATDGLVVSAGKEALAEHAKDTPVAPRYDVLYVLDGRGWYYRYSHLKSMDVKVGERVKMGQKIGVLGKEGGSGGWSHLHFEIKSRQPSGKWGTEENYAFLWEASVKQRAPRLIAVAGPWHHRLARVGESVTFEGGNSRGFGTEISGYEWSFSDGTRAEGPRVEKTYDRPGMYSEILKVTDRSGSVAYDFRRVMVVDPAKPEDLPPRLNANYAPTLGLRPGDPVTFKARVWNTSEGEEVWDFGDGSPRERTESKDGNLDQHAGDGYAEVIHRYRAPGHYLVRVERTGHTGAKAIARLLVEVQERE